MDGLLVIREAILQNTSERETVEGEREMESMWRSVEEGGGEGRGREEGRKGVGGERGRLCEGGRKEEEEREGECVKEGGRGRRTEYGLKEDWGHRQGNDRIAN